MSSTTAMILAAQDGPWAQLRTGTIVQASGGTAVVLVGAATFEASIVVPFGVADTGVSLPVPGTLVMVGRQDASWAVLGSILGVSGNLVVNPSFEDSPAGEPPTSWILYAITGSGGVYVDSSGDIVAGTQVAVVTTVSPTARLLLYSDPIQVSDGERFQLSAFAGAEYAETATEDAEAALWALWMANPTDLYPTMSHPHNIVASATNLPEAPPWTPLSGQVVAPGDGYLRVGLWADITSLQRVRWDFVTARRIT